MLTGNKVIEHLSKMIHLDHRERLKIVQS